MCYLYIHIYTNIYIQVANIPVKNDLSNARQIDVVSIGKTDIESGEKNSMHLISPSDEQPLSKPSQAVTNKCMKKVCCKQVYVHTYIHT